MLVGIVELEVFIFETNSLKEKRQVVKSLIGRLGSRFNISIAEVDDLDTWNRSVIGFSLVGNEKHFIESSISKVINFVDNDERLEIINEKIEIF